jgi:hypothetical protein
MALWNNCKGKDAVVPDPDERVLVFSSAYPPGDFLRLRLTTGQFVSRMEDAEQWAYCEALLLIQTNDY